MHRGKPLNYPPLAGGSNFAKQNSGWAKHVHGPTPKNLFAALRDFSTLPQGEGGSLEARPGVINTRVAATHGSFHEHRRPTEARVARCRDAAPQRAARAAPRRRPSEQGAAIRAHAR